MKKQLLAIPNRCTGCMRCVYVCSAVKEGTFMPSKARIHVNNFPHQGYSVPNVCFHCPSPDCLKACPEEAIYKNDRGVVLVDQTKCDACGDCVAACPYGMIAQHSSGKAYKCDLCGGSPACVTECHFGALVYKEPDQLALQCRKDQMKRRIDDPDPETKRYVLAKQVRDDAVRVPRTIAYMG
jgi:Fe-S-cluster-containing dehydrogenase component